MGGMNSNTPAGIAHFKKGVNGEIYSNISNFRTNTIISAGKII